MAGHAGTALAHEHQPADRAEKQYDNKPSPPWADGTAWARRRPPGTAPRRYPDVNKGQDKTDDQDRPCGGGAHGWGFFRRGFMTLFTIARF